MKALLFPLMLVSMIGYAQTPGNLEFVCDRTPYLNLHLKVDLWDDQGNNLYSSSLCADSGQFALPDTGTYIVRLIGYREGGLQGMSFHSLPVQMTRERLETGHIISYSDFELCGPWVCDGWCCYCCEE